MLLLELVLTAEYWVLSAGCWVLSADCWVLTARNQLLVLAGCALKPESALPG